MQFLNISNIYFYKSQLSLIVTFLLTPILALVVLVIGLASFGASFGIRRMYVKALLKIFEYATNIKQEKLKDCEELIQNEISDTLQKHNEIKKMQKLRLESFMLNSPSIDHDDNQHQPQLNNNNELVPINDIDKQKNNHIKSSSASSNSSSNLLSTLSSSPNSQTSTNLISPSSLSATNTNNSSLNINININIDNNNNNNQEQNAKSRTLSDIKRDFQLDDVFDFVNKGLQSIIDDEVTKRFTTEELTVWNLLSRTDQQYEYISFRVTVLWLFGLLLRYCVLFPFRLILFIIACFYTFISTFLIGLIPDGMFKYWLNWYASLILHRMLSRVFSAIITFHNKEYKAKCGSICVANHTSPIDVIILSTDNCYSMIGQQHAGFTGMMQRAFSRSAKHIWFDRSESKDRSLVADRMYEHVKDKKNMPILIFPEGTCINNTSVMMFKKGCFEIDTVIYPVAIKYDLRFGDAFWNSSKHTMLQYLMLMMTSWAIVVDVYYLPPMEKYQNEDAASFAKRVKTVIAKKGGFVDLDWDGMLKRASPKLDLMYEQQQQYVKHLKLN